MKLIQTNIKDEDKQQAISVRNHIISGQRVIGQPGAGLRKTLANLEEQQQNKTVEVTDWLLDDAELIQNIMLTKAGIEGEEKLCEYLALLIKHDYDLNDIVAFASLAYEPDDSKDYIPDTDVLLVYGRNVLILDAKNIKTNSNNPLRIEKHEILDSKDKLVLEVNSSTYVWQRIFKNAGVEVDSIEGYVCIVNNTETFIIRDDEWNKSQHKLIHVSELKNVLKEWIKGKDNTLHLDMLTEIAKAQIKEETSAEIDFNSIKREFGV